MVQSQRERDAELVALEIEAMEAAEESAGLAHQVEHLQSEVASNKVHQILVVSKLLQSSLCSIQKMSSDLRRDLTCSHKKGTIYNPHVRCAVISVYSQPLNITLVRFVGCAMLRWSRLIHLAWGTPA